MFIELNLLQLLLNIANTSKLNPLKVNRDSQNISDFKQVRRQSYNQINCSIKPCVSRLCEISDML